MGRCPEETAARSAGEGRDAKCSDCGSGRTGSTNRELFGEASRDGAVGLRFSGRPEAARKKSHGTDDRPGGTGAHGIRG